MTIVMGSIYESARRPFSVNAGRARYQDVSSKDQLHRQHDETRLGSIIDASRCDASELRIGNVVRGLRAEPGVVQRIMKIDADLPANALPNGNFLV